LLIPGFPACFRDTTPLSLASPSFLCHSSYGRHRLSFRDQRASFWLWTPPYDFVVLVRNSLILRFVFSVADRILAEVPFLSPFE